MDDSADTAPEQHGGNLSYIAREFPSAPQPYIDLSTSINPYPYPLPPADKAWNHRLADRTDMQSAFTACARHYAIPDASHVALGSGMQPLMFALAGLRHKEHGASAVTLLSATYTEHENVWQALGHRINRVEAIDETATGDVVIVCNPNNPDGRALQPLRLLALAEKLAARKGWLIVDESFADLMHGVSIATRMADAGNIVVLRSCGKFYGIAGMRVSIALAPKPWAKWLRSAVGPWPITTTACHQLPALLEDTAWANEMRLQLEGEAAHWRECLATRFTVIGHTPLFTLVESPDAAKWHEYLASEGILVRKFDYNPHWLRFGLPDQSHLKRLKRTLDGL